WMTMWRLRERVELREKAPDEILETTVGLAPLWPVIGNQYCSGRDGLDILAGSHQARIVLTRKDARQVIVLQRLGERYRQQAQSLLGRHFGHWRSRLARDHHRGCDLTSPQPLQRLRLSKVDFLDLDVQAREYVACRELGSAAGAAETDGLTGKLI